MLSHGFNFEQQDGWKKAFAVRHLSILILCGSSICRLYDLGNMSQLLVTPIFACEK